jgi:hypothetical protein
MSQKEKTEADKALDAANRAAWENNKAAAELQMARHRYELEKEAARKTAEEKKEKKK